MGSSVANRVRLAGLVAVASAGAGLALVGLASPPAGAADTPLRPDLVTLPIGRQDLLVEKRGKHRLLRLSNEVGNRGTAPLDIAPGAPGEIGPCADNEFDAVQRFFDDTNANGYIDDGDDLAPSGTWNAFGCMKFHDAPGHLHWHVLDFARYTLRRASTGKRIDSNKIGFCVIDTERPFPGLNGSPLEPVYPNGDGCGSLEEPPDSEGLSIGWADLYYFGLPGQSLDVTHLPRGRYCLISKTDPSNLIEESNEANNQLTVKLRLRPRKLRFHKLKGACQL
jgi:hypothetical protein